MNVQYLLLLMSLIATSMFLPATAGNGNSDWKQAAIQSEFMMVATVQKEGPTIVSGSLPRLTRYVLNCKVAEVLRGDKLDGPIRMEYQHREGTPGKPIDGEKYVVIGTLDGQEKDQKKGGGIVNQEPTAGTVERLVPVSEQVLQKARGLSGLPLGWRLSERGKPVSPWSEAGVSWPKKTAYEFETTFQDVRNGRPALTVPDGVKMTVQQIVPNDTRKHVNPFGNGKFRITVTNRRNAEATVHALLQQNGTVRWKARLLFMNHSGVHVHPGASAPGADVRPVTLGSGESVETTVNVMRLKNVDWPDGGSRVYFRFGLGDRIAESFFYYKSDYHDRIRKKLQ